MSGAGEGAEGGFSQVNDDILHNILERLPALSFASAACVSKFWNSVCSQILSRPKLVSALSLNPSLYEAVLEVLEKVLSEPIRPHFAIACIGVEFNLEVTHYLLTQKLGSSVPVITNIANGLIGMEASTDEVREVKWKTADDDDDDSEEYNLLENRDRGIVLIVGFMPGLKVDAIPLLRPMLAPQVPMIERFIRDIREYTSSVSDSMWPSCIILFGGLYIDMKPVVAMMDYAMPEETLVVGDANGCFSYRCKNNRYGHVTNEFFVDAVALVLARDREKPQGVGEIQFHFTSSTGVIPFGPRFSAVAVRDKGAKLTWLSATMEGQNNIIHGQEVLEGITEEINETEYCELYIGVRQQRQYSIALEMPHFSTSLAFYKVLGGHMEYFIIDGIGIRPGDTFLFYHSDSDTASSSIINSQSDMAVFFNPEPSSRDNRGPGSSRAVASGQQNEVFGGLTFCSAARGKPYFGEPEVDSSPFTLNFPGVPLAGIFCRGEIARGSACSIRQDQEEDPLRYFLNVFSAVYVVMSYIPAPRSEN